MYCSHLNLFIKLSLLLVLSLLTTSTNSQQFFYTLDPNATCEPWVGHSFCTGLIKNPSSIYVSTSRSQSVMVSQIDLIQSYYNAATSQCLADDSNNRKFFCNAVFPECKPQGLPNNKVINLGVGVCQANCKHVSDLCIPAGLNLDEINCDLVNSQNIYNYPPNYNQYDLSSYGGPANVQVQCLNSSSTAQNGTLAPINGTCPDPLIHHVTKDRQSDLDKGYYLLEGIDCLMPCPAPFFTHSQWSNMRLMISIVSPISFFCISMNLITYVGLNRKFDRHAFGIIFLSFSVFLMTLSDLIFIAGGWDSICPDPGRFARQSDSSCAAAGFIFQYGVVSAMLWWASMAFDLWLVIRKVQNVKSYVRYYISTINVIAIVLAIVPIFGKQYGYAVGGLGCWVMDDAWQNGVFWIPLCVCLFVGISFIFLICFEIYKIVTAVSKINGRSSKMRILRMNIKPFIIVLFIFSQFMYCFIYHFYVQDNMDRYYNNMADYVKCLVSTKGDPACASHAITVPYKSQITFLFFLRIFGIEILFFYGFTKRTKKIWLLSPVFKNRFVELIKKWAPSFFSVSSITTNNSNLNTTTDGVTQQNTVANSSIQLSVSGSMRTSQISMVTLNSNIANDEEEDRENSDEDEDD
ncbi:G-protein-coupled receptor family protein [Heterostelium album PN500]|uniref:G-protein-coupled receptor family protein n=1 Tax=Heterostelium pallidum (strain ATCC 26659 / Pp 5 / PN500) TaxID=670386 RepID=D3BM93_HETP5|nr:G-protein-coupled receptor family protein [Heterostelium album PN500]EFA77694.1 G-protein-coupled receptor family protein [Heterostelium album PN500]|eukprot:XP_020429822.1 G-protein-coupled receptor family protein [Heterostelium album PN500]